MRIPSEIFDHLQYLYDKTGFSDHQLHFVIEFENNINTEVLEKAVRQLVKIIPILSRIYLNFDGKSYWEDSSTNIWKDLFTVVYTKEDFNRFTLGRTTEETGPQLKVCLMKSEKDALSIIINHMVTDGAGGKQCIYYLADLYSKMLIDPDYIPNYVINGDRSFHRIIEGLTFIEKFKILLSHNKENNQTCNFTFPMSKDDNISPFLITHFISKERFIKLRKYGKDNNATVNDLFLTAYFRALAEMFKLHGKDISFPIMIDMRRYLQLNKTNSLTNLSSTVIVNTTVQKDENFSQTLKKVSTEMKAKKDNYLGLNTFLKLDALYKIFGRTLGFKILKKALKNPSICMTNIGTLDDNLLKFEGSPMINAFAFGSIKYRPHFQVAVSSYDDKITLSVNLYGSRQDMDQINQFMATMDHELKNAEGINQYL